MPLIVVDYVVNNNFAALFLSPYENFQCHNSRVTKNRLTRV